MVSAPSSPVTLPPVPSDVALQLIAQGFYEAIDLRYSTYCSLTARVLFATLQRLHIPAELLPCQLLAIDGKGSFAIGFTGCQAPGKWDGHVVCATETVILDAAVSHARIQAGFDVPHLVCVNRSKVPSRVIGLLTMDGGQRVLWCEPPGGFDPNPPEEPAELVHSLCENLWEYLRVRLQDAHPS